MFFFQNSLTNPWFTCIFGHIESAPFAHCILPALELFGRTRCHPTRTVVFALVRSMELVYQRPGVVRGIPVYRFVAPSTLFANGSDYAPNQGFCPCRQSGIQNVSACRFSKSPFLTSASTWAFGQTGTLHKSAGRFLRSYIKEEHRHRPIVSNEAACATMMAFAFQLDSLLRFPSLVVLGWAASPSVPCMAPYRTGTFSPQTHTWLAASASFRCPRVHLPPTLLQRGPRPPPLRSGARSFRRQAWPLYWHSSGEWSSALPTRPLLAPYSPSKCWSSSVLQTLWVICYLMQPLQPQVGDGAGGGENTCRLLPHFLPDASTVCSSSDRFKETRVPFRMVVFVFI